MNRWRNGLQAMAHSKAASTTAVVRAPRRACLRMCCSSTRPRIWAISSRKDADERRRQANAPRAHDRASTRRPSSFSATALPPVGTVPPVPELVPFVPPTPLAPVSCTTTGALDSKKTSVTDHCDAHHTNCNERGMPPKHRHWEKGFTRSLHASTPPNSTAKRWSPSSSGTTPMRMSPFSRDPEPLERHSAHKCSSRPPETNKKENKKTKKRMNARATLRHQHCTCGHAKHTNQVKRKKRTVTHHVWIWCMRLQSSAL